MPLSLPSASAFLPFGAIALLGAAGSAHCALMCGPMACSLGGCAKGSAGYQTGRLIGYAFAGAVAGLLGQSAYVSGFASLARVLTLVAAAITCVLALRRLGAAPSAPRKAPVRPGAITARVGRVAARFASASPLPRSVTLGLATALFPCALLHAALAQAAAFVAPGPAALAMLAFGVATSPATWGGTRASAFLARSPRPTARWVGGGLLLLSSGLLFLQAWRGPELARCLGLRAG